MKDIICITKLIRARKSYKHKIISTKIFPLPSEN